MQVHSCARKILPFVEGPEATGLSVPQTTHASSPLEHRCDDWSYSKHLATVRTASNKHRMIEWKEVKKKKKPVHLTSLQGILVNASKHLLIFFLSQLFQ